MILKVLGGAWKVFVNLIVLAIFAGMLSLASTGFQTIVIAGLMLIYLNVITGIALMGRLHVEQALIDARRFIKLSGLLKADEDDIEELEDELKASEEFIKSKNVAFYINIGFNFIIFWAAVIAIIGAIN